MIMQVNSHLTEQHLECHGFLHHLTGFKTNIFQNSKITTIFRHNYSFLDVVDSDEDDKMMSGKKQSYVKVKYKYLDGYFQ